jgi:hypothetical protein
MRSRPICLSAIYVAPDGNFDDWVVRYGSGRELGTRTTSAKRISFHSLRKCSGTWHLMTVCCLDRYQVRHRAARYFRRLTAKRRVLYR